MSSLQIEVTSSGAQTNVILTGQINEDSNFDTLKGLSGDILNLNLEGVTHINSCGIREWIELQKNNFNFSKIVYENCPQVIVEQMNIVAGFVHEKGEIKSFIAPYYSESEDKEYKILLTPSEILNGQAPERKGDDGEELEFDEIEAQYFNFLKK